MANGTKQIVRDPYLQETNPNALASPTQLGAVPTPSTIQPTLTNKNTNWLVLGALALLVLR